MTWNQPEVHDVWRPWRAVCDEYPDTVLVGEVCLADLDQIALDSRPPEIHQSFSFRLLKSGWDATAVADGVRTAFDAFATVGAPVSWVLGNHDKDRQVTRFGGGALGTARVRAAALLVLALPGSPYLYSGDELGLPQAVVPDAAKLDPIFHRSGGTRAGRDGCRVPIPWNETPGVGFFPAGAAEPWLPTPAGWRRHAVSRQTRDGSSTLTLHRRALALRAAHPALGSGESDGQHERRRSHCAVHRGRRDRRLRLDMDAVTALVPYFSTVLPGSATLCAALTPTSPAHQRSRLARIEGRSHVLRLSRPRPSTPRAALWNPTK